VTAPGGIPANFRRALIEYGVRLSRHPADISCGGPHDRFVPTTEVKCSLFIQASCSARADLLSANHDDQLLIPAAHEAPGFAKASISFNFSRFFQASFKRLPYAGRRYEPTETSVRFLVLVGGAVVAGAVSVGALQTLFPQQASMVAAVRAASADVSQFRVSDFNPLRWVYDYVIGEVTSPNRRLDLPSASPIVVGDAIKWTPVGIDKMGLGGGLGTKNFSPPGNTRSNRGAMLGVPYSSAERCSRGAVTVPCD
jgi:hypothetical protein